MSTDARKHRRQRDRGRVPYRLTADQVLAMRERGILGDDEGVELWGGVLYRMVKHEPHNYGVMVAAEGLRGLVPADYHVREEKSSRHGDHSLPQPDVAVARGELRSYVGTVPGLDRMALIVEVCDSTRHADFVTKPRRYARAGVPVYWVIDLRRRQVVVFGEPRPVGRRFEYASRTIHVPGETVEAIIDGRAVGRIAVEDLLPPIPPTA